MVNFCFFGCLLVWSWWFSEKFMDWGYVQIFAWLALSFAWCLGVTWDFDFWQAAIFAVFVLFHNFFILCYNRIYVWCFLRDFVDINIFLLNNANTLRKWIKGINRLFYCNFYILSCISCMKIVAHFFIKNSCFVPF